MSPAATTAPASTRPGRRSSSAGRSANGALTGLVESTPWTHFQAGYYTNVFSNFQNGARSTTRSTRPRPTTGPAPSGCSTTLPSATPGRSMSRGGSETPHGATAHAHADARAHPRAPSAPPPPAPPAPAPADAPAAGAGRGQDGQRRAEERQGADQGAGHQPLRRAQGGQQIPVGTTVDTTKGRVTLISGADGKGARPRTSTTASSR